MRILVVDDMAEKVKLIKSAIKESNIDDLEIEAVGTISKAVGDLVDNETHILIADMKIPNKYGDDPLVDGGVQLIDRIHNNKKINPPLRILLLTSVKEIYEDYKKKRIKTDHDFIYYEQSSEEWKNRIISIIRTTNKYILSTNQGIKSKKYNYDIAIITVNPRENEALKKISKWRQIERANDTTRYDETEWVTKDGSKLKVVKTSPILMGMVPAAVASMKLINHFTPKFIVMPGVAACIENEYKIGDVLIGTAVYNYSAGKYSSPKGYEDEASKNPLNFWKPDSDGMESYPDIALIAQYDFTSEMDSIFTEWVNTHSGDNYYHPEKAPEVHGGIYACGSAVVQNEAVQNIMIKNHKRKAAGVDMESYGMYYAAKHCSHPRPIPIVLKAFSDMGDSKKNEEIEKKENKKSEDDMRQEYAAFVSINFMKLFVSETVFTKIDLNP